MEGARTPMETLGHSTLGWIAMQRKSWDAAEGEFQKTLALDPNSAETDYFLGTVIAGEKNPQRMSAELFYFARAASYDGPEALAPAGRQQVLDFLKKAYKRLSRKRRRLQRTAGRGQRPGRAARRIITSGPPRKSRTSKIRRKRYRGQPVIPSWRCGRTSRLSSPAPTARHISNSGMKGAKLPTLKGKVVKLEPELKPKTLVLALEDGTTPDATLKFEMPLPGKVDPGTELIV